ncbi:MAG: xanthine dehydrogenase small subunit [Ignavibacteriales bacterium]|nr:xanthine dehydrogenase small subunit [Ignavibacteriales bacterium]
MTNSIQFILDGTIVDIAFDSSLQLKPTTTVLEYLRSLPKHRGVKEGCAEGDCGACTVVLGDRNADGSMNYRAVDSCLLFLPMLHGKQLITVENLKNPSGDLHPVQQAMVDSHGSQCGFCTPGIVMTLFALYKEAGRPSRDEIAEALAGNLCRCTGYEPIIEAAMSACDAKGSDHFSDDESRIVGLLNSIHHKSISIVAQTQRYDQPVTVDVCLELIEKHPKATLISGATDVALKVTKKFELLPHIIDCSRVEELRAVVRDDRSLRIGAGVRINDVMMHVKSDFPAFHEMLTLFAARQIRNVATLGGNIGTASPIGDALPALIAYGASVILTSRRGTRTVAADAFVKGYRKTDRQPDELIVAIVLPRQSSSSLIRSYKVSKRRDLDISTVSAGFRVDLNENGVVNDITLAFGGMSECTKRSISTESFLKGKPWDRAHVEEARRLIDADFKPISDVRGSAEFRRAAARNLLLKFWSETNG